MADNVISFADKRNHRLEEKRRTYERILFKNILGAYCVAEGDGLKALELVDISEGGLSFQLPLHSKNTSAIKIGRPASLRFYFSQDSYMTLSVKVMNERECLEAGQRYLRYGCEVETGTQSYGAYQAFVTFLSRYAEAAQQDSGELQFHYF